MKSWPMIMQTCCMNWKCWMDIAFIIKQKKYYRGLDSPMRPAKANTKLFSGGWRMRVLLAKMILQHPDVLLMDEPTNHLDLPSIEWLEKYLQHYQGAVVIVSHDRYFLDRMVTKDSGIVPARTTFLYRQLFLLRNGKSYTDRYAARRHMKTSRIISGSRKDL